MDFKNKKRSSIISTLICYLHSLVSEGWDKLAVLAAVLVLPDDHGHGRVAPLVGTEALHGHEDPVALGARVAPRRRPLLQRRGPPFGGIQVRFQCFYSNGGRSRGERGQALHAVLGSLEVSRFVFLQIAVNEPLRGHGEGHLADFLLKKIQLKFIIGVWKILFAHLYD